MIDLELLDTFLLIRLSVFYNSMLRGMAFLVFCFSVEFIFPCNSELKLDSDDLRSLGLRLLIDALHMFDPFELCLFGITPDTVELLGIICWRLGGL